MTRPIAFAALAISLIACSAHPDAAMAPDAAGGVVAAVDQALEQNAEPTEEPVVPEVDEAEPDEVGPDGEPPELPVDGPTPQMLYDQCRDRLEGPEVDGECSADADCDRAGCSGEVCVPVSKKAEIMTTCEILPCFAAKDVCGCHEGRCTWTLKEEIEPMVPRIPIKIE